MYVFLDFEENLRNIEVFGLIFLSKKGKKLKKKNSTQPGSFWVLGSIRLIVQTVAKLF